MTFKPTYLYIKTHNETGLKYFGKTIKDPYKYFGSGKLWLAHLKVHGYNVTTEILGHFVDYTECKMAALEFSKTNDIVNSSEWANLMEETLDGGFIPNSITPLARQKASNTLKERKTSKGWKPAIEAAKNNGTLFTKGMLGKMHSDETKKLISIAISGENNGHYGLRKYYDPNNFSNSVKVLPEDAPHGWISAKEKSEILIDAIRNKMKLDHPNYGRKWFNDGVKNFLIFPGDADGLIPGRIKTT